MTPSLDAESAVSGVAEPAPGGGRRPGAKRRTQAERRDAMRKRLIDATLQSLVTRGYAGTTVSSIVRRAGVSRGAHVHHFPSKDALILEATEYLMRRAYRILGTLLLGVAEEENRLQALVGTSWDEIYSTRMFAAYFELAIAAKHDPALSGALRELSERTLRTLHKAIAHYFEPRGESAEDPRDMFMLLHWVMSGLSVTNQLAPDEKVARHYLEVWARLMAGQLRARRGVRTPPPRPPDWDRAPPAVKEREREGKAKPKARV